MDNMCLKRQNGPLTERQKREMEYYDSFINIVEKKDISFEPIDGNEKRPWNSYWYVYELSKKFFRPDRNKLLDFGCGWGETSIRFAKIGYEVKGFDISQKNIDFAKKISEKYGFENQIALSLQAAENLNYPSNYFDIIVGFDILHHVEIKSALLECRRVLKDEGIAIFREPVDVPVLDYIRNTKIIKYFIPNEPSFDPSKHITQDERKINKNDLRVIRNIFNVVQEEKFTLFSRLDRFMKYYYRKGPSSLEKLDYKIFKFLPFLKRLGGEAVFILK